MPIVVLGEVPVTPFIAGWKVHPDSTETQAGVVGLLLRERMCSWEYIRQRVSVWETYDDDHLDMLQRGGVVDSVDVTHGPYTILFDNWRYVVRIHVHISWEDYKESKRIIMEERG